MAEPTKDTIPEFAKLVEKEVKFRIESLDLHIGTLLPGGFTDTSIRPSKYPAMKMWFVPSWHSYFIEHKGKFGLIPQTGAKIAHF